MKKQYIRPTIEVEHFALTQAIAACHPSYIVHSQSSACILNAPNVTQEMRDMANFGFWLDAGNCVAVPEGMSSEDGICYHINMNALFKS